MEEQNIEKIIALLKSDDEKNVAIGIELLDSLKLKQDLLDYLNQQFPIVWQEIDPKQLRVTAYPKDKPYQTVHEMFSDLHRDFYNALGYADWGRVGDSLEAFEKLFSKNWENWMIRILGQRRQIYILHQVTLPLQKALLATYSIEEANQTPASKVFGYSEHYELPYGCQLPIKYELTWFNKNKVRLSIVYHAK